MKNEIKILSKNDIAVAKKEFCDIYKKSIKRQGATELFEWLEKKSDFFVAPASSRNRLACEGGLVLHSVNVYKRLLKLVENEYGKDYKKKISNETIAICGLLHDLCKVDFYAIEMRNAKDEIGQWTKVPYYTIKDSLPYGHGEKSVYIINGFLRLTRDEAMAINWHMGGYDSRAMGGKDYTISEAMRKFELVTLLHIADLQATFLDEREI